MVCLLVVINAFGFLTPLHRVWDTTAPSNTFASVFLSSSLLSLDWAPQSESILLIGSSDGVVKLFDSTTSKYHWEARSDNKFPK